MSAVHTALQTARRKPNISTAGLLLDGIAWQMLALSSGEPQDIGQVYRLEGPNTARIASNIDLRITFGSSEMLH